MLRFKEPTFLLLVILFSQASLAIDLGFHGNADCGFAEVYIDGMQVNESAQEITAGMHEINCTARGFAGSGGFWWGVWSHTWIPCSYVEKADFDFFHIDIDGEIVASTELFGSTSNIGTVIYEHIFQEGVTIVRCAAGEIYRDVGIGVRPKLECPFEACIDDPRYIDKPCLEGYQIADHSCELIPEPEPEPVAPPLTGFITLLEGIGWLLGILGILLAISVIVYMYLKERGYTPIRDT